MQNWTGCSSFSTNNITTLIDSRDESSYTVAKLTDGKCWMPQNLKLVGNMTLTSKDSDVEINFVLPASETGNIFTDSYYNTAKLYLDSQPDLYGAYYNWYAATAGEGNRSLSSGNVKHSICPKGWRLPTKDEYEYIRANYGNALDVPANFVKGGDYYLESQPPSTPRNRGTYGYYWSSMTVNTSNAWALDAGFDNLGTILKYSGLSVRCVHS